MGALDGKVALVTGAGRLRGIGRATALALAELGADVVVTGTGRDPSTYPEDEKKAGWRDVESTAEQIRAHGRRALTWTGDISKSEAVGRLVDSVMTTFGRLDVLVNNAAYPRGNDRVPLPDLDEAIWRKVLDIKLTGAFLLCKRVVPIMIQQKWGRIINLSSIAGKRGAPNTAAYNVANFGIQGLTQSLARRWRATGSPSTRSAPAPSRRLEWMFWGAARAGSDSSTGSPWAAPPPTRRSRASSPFSARPPPRS